MLKKQLYRAFLLALLVPMIMVGSFLLYNNYSMLYEHHENMVSADNTRVRSIIFEVTTSVKNVCDYIASSQEIRSFVSNDYYGYLDANNAIDDFTMLDEFYERYTEIESIVLYTDNPTLHSYRHVEKISNEDGEWYQQMIQSPGYYWSTNTSMNQINIEYEELQLVHPIQISGTDYHAMLVITISTNYLKNRIDTNTIETDITVNHDPIFFSTAGHASSVIDFNNYHEEDFYKYAGLDQYFEEQSLIQASTIRPIDSLDSIYIFSIDKDAQSEIRRIIYINLMILIMSILIPTAVIMFYTNQLTDRITTLRTEMHRVISGDHNIIEKFKGNDELADLFQDLKIMILSIETRDQEIFQGKIKEQQLINHQQKVEMELLSSKINPHFLYNTLETIRMKAFGAKDQEVAESVKLLGRYMRYNLESTGQLTSLETELSYLKDYLFIQNLRFRDRISYDIHIDESLQLDRIKILPLLVQPIVENAYVHGHEQTTENGEIHINILDYGQNVCVQVEDNGVGMSKAVIDLLYKKLMDTENMNRSSFGLYNIHQRLRLFYGESFGLEIISEEEQGTVIQFEIPKES